MKLYPKFIAWWLAKHSVIAGALLVFYLIIGALTEYRVFDLGFIAMIFNLIMVLLPSTWAMTGRVFPLSMGVTRKQFFLMGQLLKLFCLIIVTVVLLQFAPYPPIATICSMFAATCSGELLGALSTRFGKKGMIIFTILCGCAGGVGGFMFSQGVEMTVTLMSLMTLPALPVISVLVGCCETAASWLIYRKMEVQ